MQKYVFAHWLICILVLPKLGEMECSAHLNTFRSLSSILFLGSKQGMPQFYRLLERLVTAFPSLLFTYELVFLIWITQV